jgi:light-regulated signal transduction histidine kinase (bacteriophytochrome)
MNKELESFAFVSSHDLQEPLRKIETFSRMILDKEMNAMSDSGKDYFRRIQGAASRMRLLIQDLLEYSHIAVTERTYEAINLNNVVVEVLQGLQEAILENGATIKAGKLCDVRINAFQFRQVLQNLISNSLKFSKPGTPLRIAISSRIKTGKQFSKQNSILKPGQLSPDMSYCNITFKDNGIGFESRYNKAVFDLFERLHGKEAFAGTGIGLSIVKKIVEQHEGAITASGVEGLGATFNIYIPSPEVLV